MDRIIENSNGRSYAVSAEKGDYMLLIDTNEQQHDRYVVAFRFKDGSWVKGRYYADFKEAERTFNELTE